MTAPVTRGFVGAGTRLVHYRRRGNGPAAVLLHSSPRSSAALLPLLEGMSPGLTLFALDTPGYGQSDPLPPGRTSLADFADATAEAMAALGIGRAPVYGTHTGASIAFELSRRHPGLCASAVLDGFPVFTPTEREEALASYLPPFRPAVDGTHLAWLWSRVRDQTMFFPWYRRGESARLHLPPASPAALHALALDLLRAGDNYRTAYAEAFASRPLDGLGTLRTPAVFASRMDDVLLPHLLRLPDSLPPGSTVARFPAEPSGWMQAVHAHLLAAASGAAPDLAARTDRTFYADLPGGQLLVRGRLAGPGRPLLFLHGLPGSSLDAVGALARHDGPAIAPDLPGFGDSDTLPGDPADIVVALCDCLGLGAMDVAGCGTGAVLALVLARRDPARFTAGELANLPAPDAVPPEPGLFQPHPAGAHLLSAWFHERDAAILGGWETRRPAPFASLDADALHARTVELLKARADPVPAIRQLLALPFREWSR